MDNIYIKHRNPDSDFFEIKVMNQIGFFCDKKTNIAVEAKQLGANLKIGEIYDLKVEFEEEDQQVIITNTYLVLKRDKHNVYFLTSFYNKFNKLNPDTMESIWLIHDLTEFGINMEELEKKYDSGY